MIPASNPITQNGKEVRLSSLPTGAMFICHPVTVNGFTYQGQQGTFLYATSCRARVRIRTSQADRKFKTAEGAEVVLPGQNYKETDWAPDTPVEYVGMDPYYKAPSVSSTSSNKSHNEKKETVMNATAVVEVPKNTENALTIKWKFHTTALKKALATDSASALAVSQREKIEAVYTEAIEAGVSLNPPDFNDPVFADMVFEKARVPEQAAAPVTETPAPSPKAKKAAVPASVKGKEAVAARTAAKGTPKAPKASGKAPKAVKTPSPKAAAPAKLTKEAKAKLQKAAKADKPARAPRVPKPLNTCKDGCGAKVKGNFKQGHDARYKSLVLQVQREELDVTKLPKFMAEHGGADGGPLQFTKVKDGYRCTNPAAKLK